jgi:hypothetical protein
MSAALVSLLAVGAGLGALLRQGIISAMVPTESGWIITLGRGSAARAAGLGTACGIYGIPNECLRHLPR